MIVFGLRDAFWGQPVTFYLTLCLEGGAGFLLTCCLRCGLSKSWAGDPRMGCSRNGRACCIGHCSPDLAALKELLPD